MPTATAYFHSPRDMAQVRIRTNTGLFACESLGIQFGDNDIGLFIKNEIALAFYTQLLGICAARIHQLTEAKDSELVDVS